MIVGGPWETFNVGGVDKGTSRHFNVFAIQFIA